MHIAVRTLLRLMGAFCLLCGLAPLVGYGILNTGTGAMLLLGAFLAALPLLWAGPLASFPRLRAVVGLLVCAMLLFFAVVSALMLRRGWFHRAPPGEAAVVVLGAKVNGDQPSLMLARRLYVAAQYLAANPGAVCVVSGGQGPDEDYPEARVMRDYLIRLGIAPERIIEEDQSTNTRQNLRLSRQMLDEHGVDYDSRVVLVTDGFHQLRASIFAAAEGLDSYNLPSLTPWGLLPSYWLREILGVSWAWVSIRFGLA